MVELTGAWFDLQDQDRWSIFLRGLLLKTERRGRDPIENSVVHRTRNRHKLSEGRSLLQRRFISRSGDADEIQQYGDRKTGKYECAYFFNLQVAIHTSIPQRGNRMDVACTGIDPANYNGFCKREEDALRFSSIPISVNVAAPNPTVT